jgi:uncharacterized iron-regulated protein
VTSYRKRIARVLACAIALWVVSALPRGGIAVTVAAESGAIVVDMLMGEPVPPEMMLEDLASARVVFLGETHTIARHHRVQEEILSKLADMDLKLALGMEMFGTEQQAVLDKWQRGTEPFDHLMKELGHEFWTNLKDYRSLILLARSRKIPILGINARDALVRKLARKGLDALSPEEREKLPKGFEEVRPDHARLLKLRLRVHRAFKGKSLERIVLAQALRDATMARAVARFLRSPEGKDRIVVVTAGAGHVNYGFGIPDRMKKLMDVPLRIVLMSASGQLVLSEKEKQQALPVEIDHKDLTFIRRPIADYLHLLPLTPEEGSPHTTISAR